MEETDNAVTLFTRPRHFGKTLMISMMENFLDIRKDSRDIFEGLKITEHRAFCEKWLNQYPVLFISLKDIEAETFRDAYDMLKVRLADVCKEYADIKNNARVNPFDAEIFVRLEAQTASPADAKNALKTIMRMMHAALWNRDEEAASRMISDLLWKTISYHDYHEDYYHAFLAGVFAGLGYEVESNKEKGLGRPDILLLDHQNRRAIIIEAKRSEKESHMEADCDQAIDQIITGKYAEGLYGYEQILCYGISFFQKRARVKRLFHER